MVRSRVRWPAADFGALDNLLGIEAPDESVWSG